jgi:hypothetical protein
MVRSAGLNLLERLGELHEDRRQTIIDQICAYLRQHYAPPEATRTDPGWPGVSGPLPDLFRSSSASTERRGQGGA